MRGRQPQDHERLRWGNQSAYDASEGRAAETARPSGGPEGRAPVDGRRLDHPPRVSSASFRLFMMQLKMGVSRSVYRLASAWRSSITRSRKSSGLSVSNATTNSWSSNPKE